MVLKPLPPLSIALAERVNDRDRSGAGRAAGVAPVGAVSEIASDRFQDPMTQGRFCDGLPAYDPEG